MAPISTSENWQALYLSPVHTKPKKEGKIAPPIKEKGVEWLLKNHFKGILPYHRVWEIKMEEMDSDIPLVGRGTPPFPNRPIFKREMGATRLFLKDYGKRRGLTNAPSRSVSEEEVEVKSLKRSPSAPKRSFLSLRTQTISPKQALERRKAMDATRPPSKLVS